MPSDVAASSTPTAEPPTYEVVPLLLGMSADHAIELLASTGLGATVSDKTIADRTVEHPEQWVVVEQSPAPGEAIRSDVSISMEVVKRDEIWKDDLTLLPADAIESRRNQVMIDFVGMNLSTARDEASEQDIYILDEEDATGDDRSVWIASNWVVVGQDVAPGTVFEASVRLTVVKTGEAEDPVQPEWIDEHVNESTFFGTVTGYGEGSWGDAAVLIDGLPIVLDYIDPYGAACIERISDDSRALAARDELLPIGARVVVIRIEPHKDDAFVHLVDEFDPADRFAESVNEQLVRTGYWIPDGIAVRNNFEVTHGTGVYELTDATGYLNPIQAMYAPRIIEAANGVLAEPVGGVVDCVAQAVEYQALLAQWEAEWAEQRRLWEIEYQRRLAAGYYSCRDGDGDGVCYEH